MGNVTSLLPLIVLAALFYLLLIRPQKNRQRQAQELLSKLTAGDRVITTSGIYGTVVLVDGDDVEVEVFPDVDIRFVKGAIQRILPPEEDAGDVDVTDPAALETDIDARDDSVPVLHPTDTAGHAGPGSHAAPEAASPGTDRR